MILFLRQLRDPTAVRIDWTDDIGHCLENLRRRHERPFQILAQVPGTQSDLRELWRKLRPLRIRDNWYLSVPRMWLIIELVNKVKRWRRCTDCDDGYWWDTVCWSCKGSREVECSDDAIQLAVRSLISELDMTPDRTYPLWPNDFVKDIPLYPDSTPPDSLAVTVQTITAELISYLAAHPKKMYHIKPRQFEELIAEILASYGWEVQLTPPSKDGGYDIYAISPISGSETTSWIIECKKYAEERRVGVDIVRALYGVKYDLKVANAMLATTTHFTKGVHDFKASRYDLALRDYEGILQWLNEYRPNPNGRLYIKDNQLVVPGED